LDAAFVAHCLARTARTHAGPIDANKNNNWGTSMQGPRWSRWSSANPLNWSPANKAWLVFLLSAVLHTEYLGWALVVLDEPAARAFMDLERVAHVLPLVFGLTLLSWGLVIGMARIRHYRPEAIGHEYACNLYYGVTLCVFSYFTGTLTMATGVVLAGAPVLGFILFRTAPILWSFVVALFVQALLSLGAVRGWWDYAPLIRNPAGANGELSGFWLTSMYLFVVPHLFVITLLSWYVLAGWRRREDSVRRLSLTDPLTQLANRRAIIARLRHEQESSASTRRPLSVIMIDLDHFKQLNDEHGHAAGDEALQAAGQRLARALRQSDHLGRFGGEEFLLVLPGTDWQGASLLAERCRALLAGEPLTLSDDRRVELTASLGLYCNAGDWQDSPDDMLRKADEHLYRAKAAGRNRVADQSGPGTEHDPHPSGPPDQPAVNV
jgi:diguanylate cyclase (GGDEF)-like protein